MKKFTLHLVYACTILVCVGCASTNITSFKDPAFQSATFSRILIIANTSDLQWRQKLESRMVESFNDAGVFAMESVLLFPPTRTLSNEEKVELLNQNSIDAYISVDVGESGVQDVYVPPTGSSTTTKGEVSVYGNRAQYEEKSTTTVQGGYTLSKPWAQFKTELHDVSSGSNAWIASSFTGGNAYANFDDVINSYCDKVVEQLKNDGLIIVSSKKKPSGYNFHR